MPPIVETHDLRKTYRDTVAVDGVTLSIEPGEVFSILGPNGAGKTTFVEMLEGFRTPTSGTARVLGVDPSRGGPDWKARVGVVLQTTGIFDKLTVEEVIGHFAGFYPNPESVDRVIELTGLAEKRGARCDTLSGGQKRRVDVALGIIGNPDIIFLDEPTTGFDPAARRQAWDVIRGLTSLGKTIILTTHYLDEAEHLADRVGVIVNGRLVDVGTPSQLGGATRGSAIVKVRLEGTLIGPDLPDIPGIEALDGAIRVRTDTPTDTVRRLAGWANDLGVEELPGLTVTHPSLEDVYLTLIGDEHGSPSDG